MQTQQAPASPSPARANRYPGPCSVCSIHVKASEGVYHGRTASGEHDIRCTRSDCRPLRPAPQVSMRTFEVACGLLRRARADGNALAVEIMGEITEALAFLRGETWAAIANGVAGSSAHGTDVIVKYRAAADDLVASILGSTANAHADDVANAIEAMHGPDGPTLPRDEREDAFANAPSRAPDVTAMRANRDADRSATASKPRAKRAPGNPFAHRAKQ